MALGALASSPNKIVSARSGAWEGSIQSGNSLFPVGEPERGKPDFFRGEDDKESAPHRESTEGKVLFFRPERGGILERDGAVPESGFVR